MVGLTSPARAGAMHVHKSAAANTWRWADQGSSLQKLALCAHEVCLVSITPVVVAQQCASATSSVAVNWCAAYMRMTVPVACSERDHVRVVLLPPKVFDKRGERFMHA